MGHNLEKHSQDNLEKHSQKWRQASRSFFDCVQVKADDKVSIRDSKNPKSGTLKVEPEKWNKFLKGMREGLV